MGKWSVGLLNPSWFESMGRKARLPRRSSWLICSVRLLLSLVSWSWLATSWENLSLSLSLRLLLPFPRFQKTNLWQFRFCFEESSYSDILHETGGLLTSREWPGSDLYSYIQSETFTVSCHEYAVYVIYLICSSKVAKTFFKSFCPCRSSPPQIQNAE